jgi:predicted RNase H-like HicB family nuclease
MKIIVTTRSNDYHAAIDGQSEIWGCGKTPREAVGNLVEAHKENFGVIEIVSIPSSLEVYAVMVG